MEKEYDVFYRKRGKRVGVQIFVTRITAKNYKEAIKMAREEFDEDSEFVVDCVLLVK